MSLYCEKCIMKQGDPGVKINENGMCNQCSGEEVGGALGNMRSIMKDAIDFEQYLLDKEKSEGYDCLLMLSGGKDSINMMDKLKNQFNANILAFSINHPFESKEALKNTNLSVGKLDVEHILFTPKLSDYYGIFNAVFKQENKEKTSCGSRAYYKTPCITCTAFMQIKSYVCAIEYGIKYVLYCADQFQMAHIQKNIELVAKDLYALLGDRCYEMFGDKFDVLLNDLDEEKPKIIYPYAIEDHYDPDEIVARLNKAGLYNGSPIQTHCSMYSLLNYYALKHYNMYFYAPELSFDVRNGKISREDALRFTQEFKKIILEIAVKENISESERAYIKEIIKLVYPTEEQTEYIYNNVCSLSSVAKELDIKL